MEWAGWLLAASALVALAAAVLGALRLRRLAAELARLEAALASLQSRDHALRRADRVKDEFIATLAHELRNPLAALAPAGYLLRKTASQPVAEQSAQIVTRQVTQMARLVEDLLDATRVARGKVVLSRRPLELGRLVGKALDEMRVAGRLAQHELQLALGEAWVRADDARLMQIVANLVGNAVKYTPAGGRIAVSVRRDGGQAILRVQDTGIGLSPELAARVFDLFVQGEVAEREAPGGLGIGLALVKHLAELHGGRVYVASAGRGHGAAFTVTLPAIEAQEAFAANDESAEPPHLRHRILLVEDNEDTRESMFSALAQDGHRVYEAADGEAALQTAEKLRPDVAVIDIGLPRLDGYATASTLRDTQKRGDMVLIAVTGRERPDTAQRAREAGFDELLTKPVPPERLMRAIDAAFARRSRGAPPQPADAS